MSFNVLFHPKAAAVLKKSEGNPKNRIKKKLQLLTDWPEAGKRLKHSEFWSLRIGDYRAIYEINKENKRVIVLFIGHRKKVYDDFSKLL
ncbi:MAG: type II toxin-antitoxin system RelE/ParE family toxin [Candidatus Diapherotrites archaeon]|nr:type II toxin-antitoxin system RelE/ParE family toxin [Candidatus Diapherotrites archaeon]